MDKFGEMTVFLCVAKEGSFSAAGRRLQLSPSAVSKLIARVEQRLNVRLFERVAGSIHLTQEGLAFRQASQRVVDAMNDAENSVISSDAEISGQLTIHTALTTAKYLLAPLLEEFLERYPRIKLKFMLGTERADFARQSIDVAIHSEQPTELSLVAKPLMPRPWVVAAAPAYLQKFGVPATPDELAQHRCLNFTIRTQWNSWTFREAGALTTIATTGHLSADQGELLRTFAINGLGVVRLARFHIAEDIRRGALVPLLEAFQEPSADVFYALYPQGRVLAPRVRAFLSFLEERLPRN
ncbi:DNA-binding transcriptional LysR family regulator [Paraburkholderia unamae]|uniref:LysR family transcriptional regulator n=1 Tax=Paraburkholderia unamae TaxID=219649 RepID=UPI000DC3D9BA|nr:LysR family transcriptional regulator [Paraburkholderia unamae]RAR56602.1 DNA-binding transcriptional LysR family regulator [Paraburkholderia unamae]